MAGLLSIQTASGQSAIAVRNRGVFSTANGKACCCGSPGDCPCNLPAGHLLTVSWVSSYIARQVERRNCQITDCSDLPYPGCADNCEPPAAFDGCFGGQCFRRVVNWPEHGAIAQEIELVHCEQGLARWQGVLEERFPTEGVREQTTDAEGCTVTRECCSMTTPSTRQVEIMVDHNSAGEQWQLFWRTPPGSGIWRRGFGDNGVQNPNGPCRGIRVGMQATQGVYLLFGACPTDTPLVPSGPGVTGAGDPGDVTIGITPCTDEAFNSASQCWKGSFTSTAYWELSM